MDRRANTRESTTRQGQRVSLIIFIVKSDSIINLFLSPLSIFFASPLSDLRGHISLTVNPFTCRKKKIHMNLLQQLNILLCACVHAYVCIRAFRVAVLGACSASPSAHGSCIISSEHATATGILLTVFTVCWNVLSICVFDTLQSRANFGLVQLLPERQEVTWMSAYVFAPAMI